MKVVKDSGLKISEWGAVQPLAKDTPLANGFFIVEMSKFKSTNCGKYQSPREEKEDPEDFFEGLFRPEHNALSELDMLKTLQIKK